MPKRTEPFRNNHIYHAYNRGIDRQETFHQESDYYRFVRILDYYRWPNHSLSFSVFLRLNSARQNEYLQKIKQRASPYISILTYCLMPNHFHILARQNDAPGLQFYLAQVQNSYTRNFNSIYNRDGSVFLTQFKAKHIISEYQLTHTSRYIHLNPLSSNIVSNFDQLLNYPWSSLPQFNQCSTSAVNTCNK